MAIRLEKGQRINLEKTSGEQLEDFCVKVSWGGIETIQKSFFRKKKVIEDVDLDLSSILVDQNGDLIDYLYSPEYNGFLQKKELPLGKLDTADGAMHHSGDDLGQGGGDDFSETITVDLRRIDNNVDQIFFFLNIYLNQDQSFDFSDIPFAKIEMYEGSPSKINQTHFSFDVSTDTSYAGKRAIIMGKLYLRNGKWKFNATGEATDDEIFLTTISRILNGLK